MKQTFKKPSYYLLSQAMDGDEKAIEKILAFYDPYISKCCLRPLYDEYGNCNLTEYLTKGHSNVRPSVKRWEMTGNPVKSRVVANFIEKK